MPKSETSPFKCSSRRTLLGFRSWLSKLPFCIRGRTRALKSGPLQAPVSGQLELLQAGAVGERREESAQICVGFAINGNGAPVSGA
ncbi:unnamed protein product [Spirodela intermedia]|uniref:Uncharacterized protein n=1 Tax=Spirodela intermedia TaxID=51605 RepID=A0A7I8LJE8_SPIIN|nr:unnamed protein product [Spirodela intermedia]